MKPQDQVIDNLVQFFERRLQVILNKARNATMRQLGDKLTITDGVIAKTRGNLRVLQSVEAMFQKEMKRAGYDALVQEYVARFNGQFGFFQDTLDMLGKQIGKSLKVDFGTRDKDLFEQQEATAARLLKNVISQAAQSAEQTAMLSVGGIGLGTLTEAIAEKLDASVPQAATIADTSISTYFRTIQDRGYRIIERDLPESQTLMYGYGGPNDKITRVFCGELLWETRAGTRWTRAQIDEMDNEQLPNVFITCGGYNCRHQWLAYAIGGQHG